MKSTTPKTILAGAALLLTLTAVSQASTDGLYVKLDSGVNFISSTKIKTGQFTSIALKNQGANGDQAKFEAGSVSGGVVGYKMGQVGFEAEFNYSENQVKSAFGSSKNLSGENLGRFNQKSILANVVYSPDLDGPIAVSVGAGVGVVFSNSNLREGSYTYNTVPGGPNDYFGNAFVAPVDADQVKIKGSKKSDVAFAAQIKTDVSFRLAENFTFDVAYKLRYVGSQDLYKNDIEYISDNTTPGPAVYSSEKYKLSSQINQMVTGGFTYKF
jgi:hypothetical protein